jgi:drug/metabolite transporter (DMT)-like permease
MLPVALKGLLHAMDVLTITWFRFLVASITLGIWLQLGRGLPRTSQLRGRTGLLALVACVGLSTNYAIYLKGLDKVTPATAQVVIQLAPICLLIGGIFLFRESFSRQQGLGLGIFFLGLGFFFQPHLSEFVNSVSHYSEGIGLVVLAAVCWGIYALAQKQLLATMSSPSILFLVYSFGALAYLPLAQPRILLHLSARDAGLLVFCCVNTLVAYGAFAEALEQWEASRVSAVIALTPLATALVAEISALLAPGLVPPETWGAVSILGALLVAIGSATAAMGKA